MSSAKKRGGRPSTWVGGGGYEPKDLEAMCVPELRVLCEQAGLTFVPIDLRWGVFVCPVLVWF